MRRQDRLSLFLLVALTSVVMVDTTRAQSVPSTPSAFPMTMEEARRFFSCRTHMGFDQGHGTQVFYMRPDGTEFLWYPANSAIVTSNWRLTPRVKGAPHQGVDLCFQYGTNTYNPVTSQQGGWWECSPAHVAVRRVIESVKGDIFGLARRLPFTLSRDRTSIEALQQLLQKLRPNESRPEVSNDANCFRGES